MTVLNICEGSWGSNCYALISDGHAVIIDPSASSEQIMTAVAAHNATIDKILLTHGHFDHIISLDTLRQKADIGAAIHKDDAEMMSDTKKNAFYYFFRQERVYREAEELLSENDTVTVGNEVLTVLHTPGHTKGSICLLGNGIIFTGDTLFADSFGRYDLWGGNIAQLRDSLSRLRRLDPNLTLYAGHGESARLGDALDNVAYML